MKNPASHRDAPPVSAAPAETGKADLPPAGAAEQRSANRAGGLHVTTLREDIEDLADRLALLKSRARREESPSAMLAHLAIAECRLAAALGEASPRTPARFIDPHPEEPGPAPAAAGVAKDQHTEEAA